MDASPFRRSPRRSQDDEPQQSRETTPVRRSPRVGRCSRTHEVHHQRGPSAPNSSAKFTFGVELEVIFHFDHLDRFKSALPYFFSHSNPAELATALSSGRYEYLLRQEIAEFLEANLPLAVNPVLDTIEHIEAFSVATDYTIDCSAEQAAAPRTAVIGVEIKTSCLSFTPASFYLLERTLTALQNRYRISVNESCHLHVHVGRANAHQGSPERRQVHWRPRDLQNLILLSALHEKSLSSICSPALRTSRFCKPLSIVLGAGKQTPEAWTRIIRSCESVQDLCELMGVDQDDKFWQINIQKIMLSPGSIPSSSGNTKAASSTKELPCKSSLS